MTKPNYTHIVVILDESGSMHPLLNDTLGGFNTFLDDQKNVPGEATFSLYSFNNQHKLIHGFTKIADVPHLTANQYKPSGSTALLDCMATAIDETGAALATMKEEDRPSKILVLAITDGQENASVRTTKDQVAERVKHQTDKYSWCFSFIGANMDAIGEAQKLGISAANSANYTATSRGTKRLFRSISANTSTYRSATRASDASFFDPNNLTPDEKK